MLILSRKLGERIIIVPSSGERIVVTVLETQGRRARIGVEAPREVVVNREETLARYGNGNRSAPASE